MTVHDIAAGLPPIDVLRDRCRALAVLEEIMGGAEPYYTFGAWGDDEAAAMSDGSGDEWHIVFTADGVFVRVFAHESRMSPYRDADRELWPGLLDGLPGVFEPQLEEAAFANEDGDFLAMRSYGHSILTSGLRTCARTSPATDRACRAAAWA
ncbi:hypothetical protein [Dactylosporangium sp. NPDC051541]|uniref:hypothetical protein n=1 Tax=Dactylosporangium sp. NPDC051541 TaxID=3363977 RepID=UPI0037A0C58C